MQISSSKLTKLIKLYNMREGNLFDTLSKHDSEVIGFRWIQRETITDECARFSTLDVIRSVGMLYGICKAMDCNLQCWMICDTYVICWTYCLMNSKYRLGVHIIHRNYRFLQFAMVWNITDDQNRLSWIESVWDSMRKRQCSLMRVCKWRVFCNLCKKEKRCKHEGAPTHFIAKFVQ